MDAGILRRFVRNNPHLITITEDDRREMLDLDDEPDAETNDSSEAPGNTRDDDPGADAALDPLPPDFTCAPPSTST